MSTTQLNGGQSHLFLIRIWREDRWCGRLQCLLTGEARNFADWEELIAGLVAALPPEESAGAEEAESPG